MEFVSTGISRCFSVRILFLGLIFFLPAHLVYGQPSKASDEAQEQSQKASRQDRSPWVDGENWDSLSIADSKFQAEPPFVVSKEKTDDFEREFIQVHWRYGDPIDLWVMKPLGIEKPPVVLYLYSYPSETDRYRDDQFCKRITRGGVAAVGFVSALTGQRYHSRPMKEWFVSELQESLVKTTHDVQLILNYLEKRGDMDVDRVGMFGQGSGGTIAILAAAADPRIKALNLLDPWGDWPDWMAKSLRVPDEERSRYVTPEFQKQIAPFDPVAWFPKLESRRIRIQYVVDDGITPEICQKKMEAAVPQGSTQVVKYDNTKALWVAATDGKLFDWIKEQLQPEQRAGKKSFSNDSEE
jgi:pimeloyl-ACP methyl ester carboxylesterase